MNSEIVFNKNYDSKSITVVKVYASKRTKVWKYFTIADLLDVWWAPKPWKCKTENLNFKNGGIWLYSMNGPEGEKIFSMVEYGNIQENKSIEGLDGFCDENGMINKEYPQTQWFIGFAEEDEGTKVTITMSFQSAEDMKKQLEMGFEQGFKMGLNQLEDILKSQ